MATDDTITQEPEPAQEAPGRGAVVRRRLGRILAVVVVVGISAAIIVYREKLAALGAYGYPGLFLLNLLSSATLILPAPGLALAVAAGASLNPFYIGLAVGAGSTLGELTGYLAGIGGRGIVENQAHYQRVQSWMRRYGLWMLFVLALIPNPLFDAAGITAGVMRIPVWKYLIATFAGKVIKATVAALVGLGFITLLEPRLQQWLGW